MASRVGIGYDSHRFGGPGPVILGGIEVPHDQGLDGHSDADVLAHAVTDAVLGAAGLGDIGTHFPPSDDTWENADSIELLRTAVAMVSGYVVSVDASVICEAPKLGEHREAMQLELGEAVGAPVSVKATTNEGMGWIGRGEGIACIAVASVEVS